MCPLIEYKQNKVMSVKITVDHLRLLPTTFIPMLHGH